MAPQGAELIGAVKSIIANSKFHFHRAVIFSASSLFQQQAETEHGSSEHAGMDRHCLCRATT